MVRNQAPSNVTIGGLAKAAAVGVETVRFYQRRGLLAEPDRDGGVRRYDVDDLKRLRFIRAAQTGGFTLDEIRELLALDAVADRARAYEMARSRLLLIDARIAELQTARASLARIAKECAGGGVGPCPIIESFEK